MSRRDPMKVAWQFSAWNRSNRRPVRRGCRTLPRSGNTEQPRALALGLRGAEPALKVAAEGVVMVFACYSITAPNIGATFRAPFTDHLTQG
jgi:hypothetical protein